MEKKIDNNNLNGNRVAWIDIAKGIGIFFVTFGHLSPALPLETHIYSFHMFFFFFLSGLCHDNCKTIGTIVKTRVTRLLIPFLFWNFLSNLIAYYFTRDLTDCIQCFFMISGKICWDAPIWFLWVLFLTEISFSVIIKLTRNKLQINLLFLLFFLVTGFLCENLRITLFLGIVPVALFFFTLGNLSRQLSLQQYLKKTSMLTILLIVSMALNLIFGIYFNGRISVINCEYHNYVFCLIGGVSGIIIYVIISVFLENIKLSAFLSLMGRNTLLLMCLQYYVFNFYNYLANYDIWHQRGTLTALVLALITILLILLISFLLRKTNNKQLKIMFGV
ncbi:MAG: acyltransferase family protein [Bacillota bacterium]|nr:acyltransferase family protein [Bacillota bacterium]